jgi:hypothetical protein
LFFAILPLDMTACSMFRQKALIWRIWMAAFVVMMTRLPACVVWADDSNSTTVLPDDYNSTASNATESPESTELTDDYLDFVDEECANEFRALNGNGTELENVRTTLEYEETCATDTGGIATTVCLHNFRKTDMSAYTELCIKEGGTVLQFNVIDNGCNDVSLKRIRAPLCFPSATCNTSILNVGPFYNAVPPFSPLGICLVQAYDVEPEPQGCVNETVGLYDHFRDDGRLESTPVHDVFRFFVSTTTFLCSKTKDGTWCKNDYRNSSISDFEAMCTANGGKMLQHDVTTQCTESNEIETYTMLSEPRCMGPSCSAVDALDGATYVPSDRMSLSFPLNGSRGIIEYPLKDGCSLTIKEADPLAKTASAAFARYSIYSTDWMTTAVLSLLLATVTAS